MGLPGWFDPEALATGVAFLAACIALIVIGILHWDQMMPGCRPFTVWGIAGSLATMMAVLAFDYIAISLNTDVTSFTRSSQLFFSLATIFVVFMIFAFDERRRS